MQETIGRQVTAMREAALEQNAELNEAIARGEISIDDIELDIRNGLKANTIGTSFYNVQEEEGSEVEIYRQLRRLSEIIKPKVISLNEGGVPLPVQSVVEGAKLATFIDDAVEDSIKELEQWQCVDTMEIDALKNIKGKVFIQSMSVDGIQFIADAYRCLKY